MENQIAPYSIWTQAYEKELNKKYGIELRELRNGKSSGIEEIAENKIPIFVKNPTHPIITMWSIKEIEDAIKIHHNIPGHNSMLVENKKELNTHVYNLYEAMYLHYILGKQKNIRGSFPDHGCGPSATNIQLSLIKKGYSNATCLGNLKKNHCYCGLPFILESTKEKGFIIADPTSDQLWWKNNIIPPRNIIFVTKRDKWKYETDWKSEADLFPTHFSNLATLREDVLKKRDKNETNICPNDSSEIKKYFKEVFENPIRLEI
jgi:hypothetical protein